MPKVNPSILSWAREAAGLSLEEAAHKLGFSGDNAVERLRLLEVGEKEPSRPVLVKMAEKYHRPLLTFYLAKPPQRSNKGQDFRTLSGPSRIGSEALLDALLRDVHARHGLIKNALEEAEEAAPLPFVGSAKIEDGVQALVDAMRTTLRIDLAEFRKEPTAEGAFKVLRAAVERAGIFVLLMGNLGSHHTDIDVRVFRGFALADPVAPFIVINETDSRRAWSFTLIHELAHLWLGQTGISGYDGDAEVEKFCDLVAARFLLDPKELAELDLKRAMPVAELKVRIEEFADARNVSRKMVSYNLLRAGLISAATYRGLIELFDAEREAFRASKREAGGGADYYVVRRHRVGPALVQLVGRMVAGGTLSMTKAGKVLGVKPTGVVRVVESYQAA